MEGGGDPPLDFQDWEVLTNSDSEAVVYPDDPRESEEIDADSGGMIRLDYFSIHSNTMFDNSSKTAVATGGSDVESDVESSAVESDNPSWIDPAVHTRYEDKIPAEFWSDSGSDRSDGRKVSDSELSAVEMVQTGLVVEGTGGEDENLESQLGLEGFKENKSEGDDILKLCSDSRGEDLPVGDGGSSSVEETSIVEAAGGGGGEEEEEEKKKKQLVWWKVPFELLRCCVFRVGPVWTFSMAAAVMGFVILGRKLYKMKRKARSIELKVTVDDKKVSQFMSRAARLNEAFWVVRRVPVVRPMVPGGGVNPWPVMSMR
ncbi:hypothetical protein LINGRAHAP2_LOCUS15703 [Linum grandiflorum]